MLGVMQVSVKLTMKLIFLKCTCISIYKNRKKSNLANVQCNNFMIINLTSVISNKLAAQKTYINI